MTSIGLGFGIGLRDRGGNDALSDLFEKLNSMRDDFNNHISDVTALFGKMVYRDGIGTDLANPIVGGYIRLSDGVLVQTDDSYSYQYVDVDSTKCYHLQNLISGSVVSMLALYNEDGALIKSYRGKIDGYFVFKGVSKIGLSGTTRSIQQIFTIQSFGISDINTVINTQQGNRALYVAAGAVYNEQTGFYELNGLTDITEEQMRVIYMTCCSNVLVSALNERYSNSKMRTNIGFRDNYGISVGGFNVKNLCYACTLLEVFAASSDSNFLYVYNCSRMFLRCSKLREIRGGIKFNSAVTDYSLMFSKCALLETVKCKDIIASISFSDSPLLSLESLQYLITNAANTSAITVTVHADVYAKIQDESQADWHALIASAQEKNITFATV